jgi:hypothetical protein
MLRVSGVSGVSGVSEVSEVSEVSWASVSSGSAIGLKLCEGGSLERTVFDVPAAREVVNVLARGV